MPDRSGHYESAFKALLREKGIPYVAVDDAKRALFADTDLKSFDFVVYSQSGVNLLVDVKGRSMQGKRSLQNWITEDDANDLTQWQQVFGEGFSAVVAFVYLIDTPIIPEPGSFQHEERWYRVLAIHLDEYRQRMRRRSEKWKTVNLPSEAFRELAKPIDELL